MEQTVSSNDEMVKTIIGHDGTTSGSGSDAKEPAAPPNAMVTVLEASPAEENGSIEGDLHRRIGHLKLESAASRAKELGKEHSGGDGSGSTSIDKHSRSSSVVALPEAIHTPKAVRFPESTSE